jgi:hypothetical protein
MTRLAAQLHHRTSVTGAAVDAADPGFSPVLVLSDAAAPGLHPVRGSAS